MTTKYIKYCAYVQSIFLIRWNIKIHAEKGKTAKYMFSGFQVVGC